MGGQFLMSKVPLYVLPSLPVPPSGEDPVQALRIEFPPKYRRPMSIGVPHLQENALP